MRYIFLLFLASCAFFSNAQNYVVNTIDDMDDGTCDGVHCSLREAIKAAEADGLPSTIRFNIPGAGQQNINPTGPFPTITQNDLTILGETQTGGAGTVVIDFNYRNFMGIGFWDVLASRFYISGIDFTDFLFDNPGDHLFQFGDLTNNARDCRIFNCSFITDNSFVPLTDKNLINVFSADNLSISNCNFGTDNSKTFISKLEGYINIDGNQGSGKITIDSNYFVNKFKAIEWGGGNLNVSKNLFGALDTSKAANFLNPDAAIHANAIDQDGLIHDNYFFGFVKRVIEIAPQKNLIISKNRFYNNIHDMLISGNGMDIVSIVDNYARNGRTLLSSNGIGEMYFERNNISLYDTVWHNLNSSVNQKIRHIDNRMTCINDRVIIMDPSLAPSHPIPVITSVNRNQITGSGNPNDSIIVYSNNRLVCPNTVCQAGVELGRTQADATGNWILNAAYPNRTTISAYQFDSNPNKRPTRYSEFSPCYQCLAEVKLNFKQTFCTGQMINYRGKIYSESNPKDSIFIRGDGVSICDSVILVDLQFNNGYRFQLNVPVCYEDTLRYGNVIIHKNHLSDSLLLKSVITGCDSIITITGREVGLRNYDQTICDNASITIGGIVFDKNNRSGIAKITGAAVGGCDSIVFVNLTINNFTESFLNRTMCPGDSLIVGTEVFKQSRLSGDVTLKNASSTGCDSIVHVSLNYPNNSGSYSITLCSGDSLFIIDRFFSERNPTAKVTTNNGSSHGCDTIVDVNVVFLPNSQGTFTSEICRGDTINVLGELFYSGKTTGSNTLANMAANGCDSTINIVISIIPDAIGNLDTSICENASLTLYGEVFNMLRPRGSIRIPDASFRMCDSFLMVNVQFVPESNGNFRPAICQKDSIQVGTQFFSARNPSGSVRFPFGSSSGCDSVVNVQLTINPPIFADILANELKCNSPNTGELVLQDIRGGSGNFKVSIDNGALINYTKGQVIGNLAVGTHMIRISDQLNCDTTYTFTISNSQVLSLQLPNDTIIKKGNPVNINALINFNPKSIKWDPPAFLSCDTCLNPQSLPDNTITYTLTVTDQNDCAINDVLTITVIVDVAEIYVPTAFSPNGDNINDIFFPVFKFPETTAISIFRVYDRWGNQVFERLDGMVGESIGWDGTVDQEKLNPGVYIYAIQFIGEDGVAKWASGDITLIR